MDGFLATQKRLLQLEHEAELEENQVLRSSSSAKELESIGVCIRTLHPAKVKSGLSGRILVSFVKEHGDLPHTKLSSGDIVGVFTRDLSSPECSGVIYSVHRTKLVVACEEFTLQDAVCNVVLLANDVTHKRQMQVIESIGRLQADSPAYRLSRVVLGEAEPRFNDAPAAVGRLFNEKMNRKQRESIAFATNVCKDISIIHGPPGTGKTTTLVEVILQLVARGEKVLATAPSNIAVDNMLEQLAGQVPVVRLGHPARILPHLEEYSLDHKVKRSDQSQLVLSVNKDISRVNDQLAKARGAERSELRMQLRDLRKEAKVRSSKAVTEVLTQARVVLATNVASGMKDLHRFVSEFGSFDTVVIDEAAQALEASCWIPLLKGKRLILSGDHKQLPPTIKSQDAQAGLSHTMMSRLCDLYPTAVVMLEEQYRMNTAIMQWPSDQFYGGRLTANESVSGWTIPESEGPLLFIDTAGCEMRDSGSAQESKYNLGEASVVSVFLEELRLMGVANIGVITPYSAQVEVLLSLSVTAEVSTVDGFQGREKDAIVISMVRSNEQREVGFLADERRLNVAITRARKLLCIVGDSETLGSNRSTESLRSFVKHLHEHAVVRGVQAYYQHDQRIVFNQGALSAEPAKPKPAKLSKPKQTRSLPQPPTSVSTKPDLFFTAKTLIEQFLDDEDRLELVLEPMPGNVREQLHRLCESLGLGHASRGSGNSRYMVVTKAGQQDEEAKPPSEDENPIGGTEETALEEVKTDLAKTSPPQKETVVVAHKHTKTAGKTEKKQEKTAKQEPLTADEEMKFLEDIVASTTVCQYPGCQEALHAFSVSCRYCGRSYCLTHSHAETHGCGSEACRLARASLTVTKPSKLKEYERKALLSKLHKKQAEERPPPKPKKRK